MRRMEIPVLFGFYIILRETEFSGKLYSTGEENSSRGTSGNPWEMGHSMMLYVHSEIIELFHPMVRRCCQPIINKTFKLH